MSQQIVNVYRDRERAGGFRNVLATEMGDAKRFGKQYERMARMMAQMEPEDQLITTLENFYFQVNSVHRLPEGGLQEVVDAFRSLPRNIYKNPQMFLLGWLFSIEGLNVVKRIIAETGQVDISDCDVIRYYRLYRSFRRT